MIKKRCSIVLSIILISMFLCSGSFAQDIPVSDDLEPYFLKLDLTDPNSPVRVCMWSITPTPPVRDIGLIKDNLEDLKDAIYATLPTYQQKLYDETKKTLKIEDESGELGRLSLLESIEVYVAKSGVTFDDIKDFYTDGEGKNSLQVLEDLEQVADAREIDDRRTKLQLAFAKIPDGSFPTPGDRERLADYIEKIQSPDVPVDEVDPMLKGLIGTSTSGLSNISIQLIYVDPEINAVRDETTDGRKAWVIISTYSEPFERPPLQPSP